MTSRAREWWVRRGRAEALHLFAVISVQLATLSEQLRPLGRLYAARRPLCPVAFCLFGQPIYIAAD